MIFVGLAPLFGLARRDRSVRAPPQLESRKDFYGMAGLIKTAARSDPTRPSSVRT
jgi:hypothetical protein